MNAKLLSLLADEKSKHLIESNETRARTKFFFCFCFFFNGNCYAHFSVKEKYDALMLVEELNKEKDELTQEVRYILSLNKKMNRYLFYEPSQQNLTWNVGK